jgi:hypothetical protein
MKQSHKVFLGSLGTFSLFALGTVGAPPAASAESPSAPCAPAHASIADGRSDELRRRKEAARQAALAFIRTV